MQQSISVEQITDKAVLLNSIQRQTVYDFIDFLLNKNYVTGQQAIVQPGTASEQTNVKNGETATFTEVDQEPYSLQGLWKGFSISESDINEARQEMWASFGDREF